MIKFNFHLITTKTLASVFFVFFSLNACAYIAEFDELLDNADQIKSADREQFEAIIQKLKPLFDQMSIDQKYFFTYLNGYKFVYEGKVEQGIKSYVHVFDNAQSHNHRHRAAVSLLNVFAYTKNWESAFKYLDYVNKEGGSIAHSELRHNGWISSGIFYNELEQYDLALLMVNRLKNEGIDGRSLCFANSIEVKASVSLRLRTLDESFFSEKVRQCEDYNEKIVASVVTYYFAQYLIENNQPQKARYILESGMSEVEARGFKFAILGFRSLLAKALLLVNELDAAEMHASIANGSSEDQKDSSLIYPVFEARNTLYQIALKRNNFQQALEQLRKLHDLEIQRSSEAKSKQLAIELAKHRAKEKDIEIELLNNRNKILQLEAKLATESVENNRWLFIFLLVLVSLLIAWGINVRRSQRQLKFLAEYDNLTGISNRSHFTKSSEALLSVLEKSSRSASLILFDLDYFKKINDSYGHAVGDEVLKITSQECKKAIRKVDILGRVGGEEFAIFLPGCDLDQAQKIAEDCRLKINQIDTSLIAEKFEVSASFGVATAENSHYELKELMARADEAMYLAKRRGRNQVILQN